MSYPRCLYVSVVLLGLLVSQAAAGAGLSLHSKAFDDGQPIPQRYACDGAGVSPPLTISGVPDKARSMALIVDDPDSPSGDWTHWALYNLAPDLVVLAPGAADQPLPGPASMAANSYHKREYGAVCPPKGDGVHHYRFTLYVLDKRLPDHPANKKALQKAMQGHIMARTRLTGTYARH